MRGFRRMGTLAWQSRRSGFDGTLKMSRIFHGGGINAIAHSGVYVLNHFLASECFAQVLHLRHVLWRGGRSIIKILDTLHSMGHNVMWGFVEADGLGTFIINSDHVPDGS